MLGRSLQNVGYYVLIILLQRCVIGAKDLDLDIIFAINNRVNYQYFADLPATLCLHCVISVVMGFNCG